MSKGASMTAEDTASEPTATPDVEEEEPEFFPPTWQRRLRVTSRTLFVLIALVTMGFSFYCYRERAREADDARDKAAERASDALAVVDSEVSKTKKAADGLAEALNSGKIDWSDVRTAAQSTLDATPDLQGVTVVVDPTSPLPSNVSRSVVVQRKDDDAVTEVKDDPAALLLAAAGPT